MNVLLEERFVMRVVYVFVVRIVMGIRRRYGEQKLLLIIGNQIILMGYHHMYLLENVLVRNLYVKRNIVNVIMRV